MEGQISKIGERKVAQDGKIELPVHLQVPKLNGRKISPGGIIDLPLVARVTLGFHREEPKFLKVEVTHEGVVLKAAHGTEADIVRVSALGLLQLPKLAHEAVSKGGKGRYTLEIRESDTSVLLRPA